MINEYGFKNVTKWVLVRKAVFTASGLNEIVASAEYRAPLLQFAKVLGIRSMKYDGYAIFKVADIQKESKE